MFTREKGVQVKSRMLEICKSGSVRDCNCIPHGQIMWHSAYRKNGVNRENKLNLKGISLCLLEEYLEELPEQEAAWNDWSRRLSGWRMFNTLYTNYLMVQNKRIQYLRCVIECEHCCPRQVIEDSPSNIKAVCPENKVEPVKLTFKDTLIYTLRRESFHQAICRSLNIKYSADRWHELKKIWFLGDYCGMEVYVTYRTAHKILTDAISSLYLSNQKPFILMVPTVNNITPEIQRFIAGNNFLLFPMAAELSLQHDGSFRARRGMSEYM